MDKKVAFITGGSRGIGKEIARKFAENGYNLVINYVSENTDLEKLKNDINSKNEILFVRGKENETHCCKADFIRSYGHGGAFCHTYRCKNQR